MLFWVKWAACAGLCVVADHAAASDWPQFLGPNRDGGAADRGLVAKLDGKLPQAWRQSAGLGVSGPVVAAGKVHLFHQIGDDEVLSALDAGTGKELWKLGYPCPYAGGMFRERGPRATPTVTAEGILTFGADGALQWVGHDGKRRWLRKLHEEYQVEDGYFGACGSPVVHGGLALLNLGGAPNAGLVAVRLADGKTAWAATADTASYASPLVAEIAGKPLALIFARGGLHGVDPATGAVRFFHRFRARMNASVNAATPLVRGNEVFLSSSYGVGSVLLDLSAAAPREAWRQEDVLACHFNTPVRIGEHLYGIDGRHEERPQLQCVEWKTGKPRWSQPAFGPACAIAADGKLWLVREDGALALAAADPEKFVPLGEAKLFDEGPVRAHPALAGGFLYVRGPKELAKFRLTP